MVLQVSCEFWHSKDLHSFFIGALQTKLADSGSDALTDQEFQVYTADALQCQPRKAAAKIRRRF